MGISWLACMSCPPCSIGAAAPLTSEQAKRIARSREEAKRRQEATKEAKEAQPAKGGKQGVQVDEGRLPTDVVMTEDSRAMKDKIRCSRRDADRHTPEPDEGAPHVAVPVEARVISSISTTEFAATATMSVSTLRFFCSRGLRISAELKAVVSTAQLFVPTAGFSGLALSLNGTYVLSRVEFCILVSLLIDCTSDVVIALGICISDRVSTPTSFPASCPRRTARTYQMYSLTSTPL